MHLQLLLFQKIKKGRYKFESPHWDGISADAKNLISNLLVLDPRRRLSVEQALKHPWIVGDKVCRLFFLINPESIPCLWYTHVCVVRIPVLIRFRARNLKLRLESCASLTNGAGDR